MAGVHNGDEKGLKQQYSSLAGGELEAGTWSGCRMRLNRGLPYRSGAYTGFLFRCSPTPSMDGQTQLQSERPHSRSSLGSARPHVANEAAELFAFCRV
jgi:hypothetical protein